MIIPIPYVQMGLGTMIAVFSIPLVMRKIPMNHLYGIRIKRAFSSDKNWYDINAFGGKLFLAFGVALFAFGYLLREQAPSPRSIWAPVFLVIPLLLLIPIVILIGAYARSLPNG